MGETVVLGNNSTIAGFQIENSDYRLINTRCAVCLENKMGTIIRNNSISTYQPDRNGSGIYISGNGGNHSIISNHFTRSTYSINEVSQTYRSKAEYNLFQNVRFTAVVRVGNLDLGGGGSSAGENTFRCYNFTSQILTEGLSGVTVFARNNIWGHIPIQQTTNMNDWCKDIMNLEPVSKLFVERKGNNINVKWTNIIQRYRMHFGNK
ncbi:PF07602 family protein [Leptospira noguchii serovar Panama str. CZ214]|uniref:PF07602 family protein n=1 Tax=Leptospira noguchii serovar Panama str. CZ214 TaxID=1001595 RepID=T0FLQ3_9LEPT|nr:PF07602 family protein [Leptospira noguchii serovar Panama str. CZ214]